MAIIRGHRDDVVTTLFGHTVRLTKGEDTSVADHPQLLQAISARGHKVITEAELEAERKLKETEAKLAVAEAKIKEVEASKGEPKPAQKTVPKT